MSEMLDRMAKAIYGRDEATWKRNAHTMGVAQAKEQARRALAAARYEDGTDETSAIAAGLATRHDPVTVIECWDCMIDAVIKAKTPT